MLVFKGKLKEHPRWEVENELYRFRNRVFSDRLGWDVESRRGLERDNFDKPDTHWVLIEDKQGLCGCSCFWVRGFIFLSVSFLL